MPLTRTGLAPEAVGGKSGAMRLVIVALFALLAACGRPLTPSETDFLAALQGDQTDPAAIRLTNGHFAGSVVYHIPVRPRTTCQERIWPPVTEARSVAVSPAATVIFNRVLLRKDIYREDLLEGWPDRIDLVQAMLFAHEATHVWQWQNRKRTGYHPIKALREHANSPDPYLFDTGTETDFLSFGYEQQGSIVEEYVCCRLLDPQAPRTDRLRRMIAAHMPIDGLETRIDRPLVGLPWAGVETEGICRDG